ncbi:MAG TPA: putative Ig domain-containing protein [Mycobacteriales bacterium]|nr:putative Ig domain-containing protein [Mycobacteriales bacterium]
MPVRIRFVAVTLCALMAWTFGTGLAFAAGKNGGGGHVRVKVTNPGSQTSATGGAVDLQIQASDTNGGALSYTATGLPSGLTIGTATGVISGTPTAAVQASVDVTATDTSGGASASTAFGWTVNAAYDVSYPQCGTTLPTAANTSLVGVNDGIVYSANPCLATQAGWGASHGLQFYANTADPGPAYSSYWPTGGQASPQDCTTTDQNSTACSYDYGYNAARNSYGDAIAATAGTSINPAGVSWWLDVETGNSWETLERAYGQTATSQQNDTAALQGAAYGLTSEGVTTVGFYSTSYQWDQITGGTGATFQANPAWLAGYTSLPNAQSGCTSISFTDGPVVFTQYPSGSFDADFPC